MKVLMSLFLSESVNNYRIVQYRVRVKIEIIYFYKRFLCVGILRFNSKVKER